MRELTLNEIEAVSGGNPAVDARADTSSDIVQETPNTAGAAGMAFMGTVGGKIGAAYAVVSSLLVATKKDFDEEDDKDSK